MELASDTLWRLALEQGVEWLHGWRASHGMTQTEAAVALGLSQGCRATMKPEPIGSRRRYGLLASDWTPRRPKKPLREVALPAAAPLGQRRSPELARAQFLLNGIEHVISRPDLAAASKLFHAADLLSDASMPINLSKDRVQFHICSLSTRTGEPSLDSRRPDREELDSVLLEG
jgi:hypothetical protein